MRAGGHIGHVTCLLHEGGPRSSRSFTPGGASCTVGIAWRRAWPWRGSPSGCVLAWVPSTSCSATRGRPRGSDVVWPSPLADQSGSTSGPSRDVLGQRVQRPAVVTDADFIAPTVPAAMVPASTVSFRSVTTTSREGVQRVHFGVARSCPWTVHVPRTRARPRGVAQRWRCSNPLGVARSP